jgi:hypothetical protein
MNYSFEDIKNMADKVRSCDLPSILIRHGCKRYPRDKTKWKTPVGILSVNGQKFMNWTTGTGGGGAIDLIIALQGLLFKDAVLWLYNNSMPCSVHASGLCQRHSFVLPVKNDGTLSRVIHYLTEQRRIPSKLIDTLIQSGKLYADNRANAVFLLLGKKKTVVGAELRGTGKYRWRGMAKGSRKNQGCFYLIGSSHKKLILCESAIDAASCFVLNPEYTAVSTSGAAADPGWLKNLVKKKFEIYCGFDRDQAGTLMAQRMMRLYPSIKRFQPLDHDWNDALRNSRL